MPGDAEYAWLDSASTFYQHGWVHGIGGLARSPAFSFGGRWGFRSPRASAKARGCSWGHSRGYSTYLTSHFTYCGGLWGWRRPRGYWLCSRSTGGAEYLGSLAYSTLETPQPAQDTPSSPHGQPTSAQDEPIVAQDDCWQDFHLFFYFRYILFLVYVFSTIFMFSLFS